MTAISSQAPTDGSDATAILQAEIESLRAGEALELTEGRYRVTERLELPPTRRLGTR